MNDHARSLQTVAAGVGTAAVGICLLLSTGGCEGQAPAAAAPPTALSPASRPEGPGVDPDEASKVEPPQVQLPDPPQPAPRTDNRPSDPDQIYPWTRKREDYEPIAARFAPPPGAIRAPAPAGSYAHWLRHLPLRAPGTAVRSYDDRVILSADDGRLAAVVDLDLIGQDLQQCADTVLRLRAEYLRVRGRHEAITFDYTNGWASRWSRWKAGFRPRLVGNHEVKIVRRAADDSRQSFDRYLLDLFSYAGTVSLAREASEVKPGAIEAGDFFILPGGPGHTVLVLDLARDGEGQTYALLGQGFMPAQDFQVLRASSRSPWYRLDPEAPVDTPMWKPFPWSSLRRLER